MLTEEDLVEAKLYGILDLQEYNVPIDNVEVFITLLSLGVIHRDEIYGVESTPEETTIHYRTSYSIETVNYIYQEILPVYEFVLDTFDQMILENWE